MVPVLGGPPHHAMKRESILHHAGMNAAPIVGLLAGKHLARALAGDLLPIDIAELSSCQPEGGVVQAVPDIDQADTREGVCGTLRGSRSDLAGMRRAPADRSQ